MFSRVVYPLLGIAYWQKAYEDKHELAHKATSDFDRINQEFVSATETYVKIAIYALIVLGVLLDIVVWKQRRFASWLLYYECVSFIVQGFVPFDYGNFRTLVL